METVKCWILVFAAFYVLPLVVGIAFAFLHNKENPFRKNNSTTDWVFMPVMNFACMLAIIFYGLYKLVTCILSYIKRLLNKIDKWNKD